MRAPELAVLAAFSEGGEMRPRGYAPRYPHNPPKLFHELFCQR